MKRTIFTMVALLVSGITVSAQSSTLGLGSTGYSMVPAIIAASVAVAGVVISLVAKKQ